MNNRFVLFVAIVLIMFTPMFTPLMVSAQVYSNNDWYNRLTHTHFNNFFGLLLRCGR